MHPDLTRPLAEARRADLLAQAEKRRLARRPRSSRSFATRVSDDPLRAVPPQSRAAIVDPAGIAIAGATPIVEQVDSAPAPAAGCRAKERCTPVNAHKKVRPAGSDCLFRRGDARRRLRP